MKKQKTRFVEEIAWEQSGELSVSTNQFASNESNYVVSILILTLLMNLFSASPIVDWKDGLQKTAFMQWL